MIDTCTQSQKNGFEQIRFDISKRLRKRSPEIVDAIYARVQNAVPDPLVDLGADYQSGVLSAITALVEYGLGGIERGWDWSAPIPREAVMHVRHASRIGVNLSIVQRRSFVGHRCLGEFVAEEAESIGIASHALTMHDLHIGRQAQLEHLMGELEREYEGEREQRRVELVRRLLIEDLDTIEVKELGYNVRSYWHVGVATIVDDADEVLGCLAAASGKELLSVVDGDEGTIWAWLGSRTKLSVSEFKCLLSTSGCRPVTLAIGDPGVGLEGWRQTHAEARMALLVARHRPQDVTRCADVLPLVGALQSRTMIRMYEKVYILPLNSLHGCGQAARKSLLAYFKHGRNASSAGKAVGVTRRTIENHLCDVRDVLGDPLDLTALEVALRLEELGYIGPGLDAPCRVSLDAIVGDRL